MKQVAILLTFLLAVQATTLHVAPWGNDNWSGATAGLPKRSLANAIAAGGHSSIIYLRGGNEFTPSLTTFNDVTIKNYPGEVASLIIGADQTSISLNADGWMLEGITLSNTLIISGSRIAIKNCVFTNGNAILVNGASGLLIEGSKFDTVDTLRSIQIESATNVVIRQNTFVGGNNENIFVKDNSEVSLNDNQLLPATLLKRAIIGNGTAPSPSRSPSASPTPTASPSASPSSGATEPSPSRSPSSFPTPSASPSSGATAPSPSRSPSASPTPSASPSSGANGIDVPARSPSSSPTPFASPSSGANATEPSPSRSPSSSPTPSASPSSGANATEPSPSRSPSASPTPTASPSASPSSGATAPSPSRSPSSFPTPSASPSSGANGTAPSPSRSPSASPTPTASPSASPSSGANGTAPSPARSPSSSPTPSASPSSGSAAPSTSPTPAASRSPSPANNTQPTRSPARSPSRTPSPSMTPQCVAPTPFNCGTFCAASASDCVPQAPAKCNDTKPFRCSSGECVVAISNCTKNVEVASNCTVLCWDGSCADKIRDCPPVPPCPLRYRRCGDICQEHDCNFNSTVCNFTLCADGTCPRQEGQCNEYNGCPLNQFACPDGRCVLNFTECLCSATEFLCWNGNCSASCDAPPAGVKPLSYGAYVNSGELANLPIMSEDGTSVGTINIRPQGNAIVSMSSVPDSVISEALKDRTLITPVISLEIDGVPSSNFQTPVTICLSFTLRNHTNSTGITEASSLCLAFINSVGEFECVSDVTIEEGRVCGDTTHFTEFAVGNFKSTDNSGKSDNGSSSPASWIWIVVAVVGAAVLAAVIVVAIVVARKKNSYTPDFEMDN